MHTPVNTQASSALPASRPHAAPSFDWREYYYAIKARFWIVLICLMLATLWGIFTVASQKAKYSAKSVLFIEQGKSRILSLKVEEVRDDQIRSSDMINTLIDTMKSYPFALRMVNHYKLTQDPDFLGVTGMSGGNASPERAAAALTKMVTPAYRINTRLIDIIVTTGSPSLSVKLANDFAEEYLRYLHDQRENAARSASSFLMDEADRLRKKMRASDEGMQNFRERERAASIESMLQEAQHQITDLSARQSAIQSKLTQINSDLEVARKSNGNRQELLRLPSVGGEPKVAGLVTQLDSLNGQLVLVQQRYRSKHPLFINTRTQIEVTSKELDKVLSDVVGLLESIKSSLEAQDAAAKIDREAAEKRLLQVTSKSIEYNDLKREQESDSALYDAVVARLKEVDFTKELTDAPVELQEAATGATPINKSPIVSFLLCLLKGAGVGVALVLGLYKLDTSIKTIDEVERVTGLGVLSAIPQIGGASTSRLGLLSKEQYQLIIASCKTAKSIFNDKSQPIEKRIGGIQDALRPALAMIGHPHMASALPQGSELVVKDDRSGLVAEAFRSLRATVAMNIHVENQRVFLFTSAVPSEGKSFCSSNFSTTLAQQGLKTLLIDADLRKPAISRVFFGMNRKPGLSEVLLGTKSLDEAVQPSGVEGLTILTAGGRASNPAELLAHKPFRDLVAKALEKYDRVVIDSAPVLAISDTLLIAPTAEVLCLVVRSFMTPSKMVSRALKSLGDVHIRPAGIVFNCLPTGAGGHSYYYSGKYEGTYGGKEVYGA